MLTTDDNSMINAAISRVEKLQADIETITEELFKLDEANYLPEIDSSKTYIVLAGNCTKTTEATPDNTDLVKRIRLNSSGLTEQGQIKQNKLNEEFTRLEKATLDS